MPDVTSLWSCLSCSDTDHMPAERLVGKAEHDQRGGSDHDTPSKKHRGRLIRSEGRIACHHIDQRDKAQPRRRHRQADPVGQLLLVDADALSLRPPLERVAQDEPAHHEGDPGDFSGDDEAHGRPTVLVGELRPIVEQPAAPRHFGERFGPAQDRVIGIGRAPLDAEHELPVHAEEIALDGAVGGRVELVAEAHLRRVLVRPRPPGKQLGRPRAVEVQDVGQRLHVEPRRIGRDDSFDIRAEWFGGRMQRDLEQARPDGEQAGLLRIAALAQRIGKRRDGSDRAEAMCREQYLLRLRRLAPAARHPPTAGQIALRSPGCCRAPDRARRPSRP